ncbi:uncharacterized protein LOC107642617 isoform X1 [Arachis ipaensis]|uniref:uncharacterized protein LOC107642617 isoform X1 n=1 Tax=Arachis ipaensis TaxID=130454 RepID=UPI000A2B06DC|nr:uncharacterized protein LOC107642617 isoform X1 [Arachis ipaensis]
MAALSPAPNNNNQKAVSLSGGANPPKSQRGQNKPKCKQCGNVARSRCPFESCKSCCSRNQNPCHIHVLKTSTTLPDKAPSSSAAPIEQQSVEPSQSSTASRVASLRQLSNSFAQFNNLNISFRSRKPLTRKCQELLQDAAAINEWRFSKLKEYKERNIELENETFDRYMQNIDLLEEVLAVKSMEDNVSSESESNTSSMEAYNDLMITKLKLQIRSNSVGSDAARMRMQQIVDRGLKKLKMSAVSGAATEALSEDPNNTSGAAKSLRTERLSAISDLIDKINKARSEEDLKSCLEIKSQLFNLDGGSSIVDPQPQDNETDGKEIDQGDSTSGEELEYSLPKLVGTTDIDQETLNTIDNHFSSLEYLEL